MDEVVLTPAWQQQHFLRRANISSLPLHQFVFPAHCCSSLSRSRRCPRHIPFHSIRAEKRWKKAAEKKRLLTAYCSAFLLLLAAKISNARRCFSWRCFRADHRTGRSWMSPELELLLVLTRKRVFFCCCGSAFRPTIALSCSVYFFFHA